MLTLSRAAAFHEVNAERVDEQIESLANQISVPSNEPIGELDALADLLDGVAMPEPLVGSDVCCLMLDDALLAANLRLSLPLDDESSQVARLRLERVRARLN